MIFAKAGEPVTTEDGKIVCYLKNDLSLHGIVQVSDFHQFSEGEAPFVPGQIVDPRIARPNPNNGFGLQICIDGEWRP